MARARKDIYTSDDIAKTIVKVYGSVGVVSMDEDPSKHPVAREQKEAEAKQINRRYHEGVVARYEDERKSRQLTGRGRLQPTAFELDCYRALGILEPGTLEGIKAELGTTTEVKFELPPEVADPVADGLAARRAKVEPAAK